MPTVNMHALVVRVNQVASSTNTTYVKQCLSSVLTNVNAGDTLFVLTAFLLVGDLIGTKLSCLFSFAV